MKNLTKLAQLEQDISMLRELRARDILTEAEYQAKVTPLLAEQARLSQPQAPTIGERSVVGSESKVAQTGDQSQATYIENQTTYNQHQTIYQHSPGPDKRALTEAYLHTLIKQVGQVSLSGIDPKAASDQVDSRLNLGDIYTALLTLSSDEHARWLKHGTLAGADCLSALAQLNQHNRLVLLGDPGSGKSTFVNFVALCLAGERLKQTTLNLARLTRPLPDETGQPQDEPQSWGHGPLLPILVILRDFAARGLPPAGQRATARHLWKFIAQELQANNLGDYVKPLSEHLWREGALILLDGLDEVPEAGNRRLQMKQAIETFANSAPRCRIVVTSRTYAYQKQAWRLPGFQESLLAPFSAGQIRCFVAGWYRHLVQVRGLPVESAQGRAELLKRAIFNSDRLRELAERPLLLTLMASLHAWRGGSLPEKREELYADTVELLLDWWESPKIVRDEQGQVTLLEPSLAEWLKLADRTKLRTLLNELSFQAQANQPELVGTADIDEGQLVSGLMRLSDSSDLNPANLVRYLSQRAGLLLPRGVGVYTFPHRTFQEYLAACHITDLDEFEQEMAHLARTDPNRWREVTLLAGAKAGRGSVGRIWALVDELCPLAIKETTITPACLWGALLAGQLLQETASLERLTPARQQKVNRVKSWQIYLLTQSTLSALERAKAGMLLAHLGDDRPGVGLQANDLPDMIWCKIPAGPFLMGSDKKIDEQAYDDETPQHTVNLPLYYLSRYPITNAQFSAFVKDGGYTNNYRHCWTEAGWAEKERHRTGNQATWAGAEPWTEPRFWHQAGWNEANRPVVGVSWYEAVAYCNWLTEKLQAGLLTLTTELTGFDLPMNQQDLNLSALGRTVDQFHIRLPTEAEWEKGACGSDGRLYPWGNQADPNRANYKESQLGETSAVGCFSGGVSPDGCQEMSGNVWEWCATQAAGYFDGDALKYKNLKFKSYPYQIETEWGDAYLAGETLRMVRGGACRNVERYARASIRNYNTPGFRYVNVGFRIVLSPIYSES